MLILINRTIEGLLFLNPFITDYHKQIIFIAYQEYRPIKQRHLQLIRQHAVLKHLQNDMVFHHLTRLMMFMEMNIHLMVKMESVIKKHQKCQRSTGGMLKRL